MGSIHVELMVSCNRGGNVTDQLIEPITGITPLVFDPSRFQLKKIPPSERELPWQVEIVTFNSTSTQESYACRGFSPLVRFN